MAISERLEYSISLQDKMSSQLSSVNAKLNGLNAQLRNAQNSANSFSSSLRSITGLIGGLAAVSFAKKMGTEMLETTMNFERMNRAILFASESSLQGERSLRFLKATSNELGLSTEAMTEGFRTFQGAMMGSNFGAEEIRTMFQQISKGAAVMGLSADDAKGTFLALGQIMSKGTVQAEELRGQIGERIPGAFGIAARAMGVTESELSDLMKQGKLLSEDFLPRFAMEMERTFASGKVEGLTSDFQTLGNAWDNLMTTMGERSSGFWSWISDNTTQALNGLAMLMESQEQTDKRNRGFAIDSKANALNQYVKDLLKDKGYVPGKKLNPESLEFLKRMKADAESHISEVRGEMTSGSWGDEMDKDIEALTREKDAWTINLGFVEDLLKQNERILKSPTQFTQSKPIKNSSNVSLGADVAGVAGTRTNMTINIEKLIETFNIQTTNLKDGVMDAKKIVLEGLLRAVNDTQLMLK